MAATGHAATTRGALYVEQLCKHWSHKLQVERSGASALIRLPSGARIALAPDPEGIAISITAADASALDQAKSVLTAHLDRFAFREAPIPVQWTPA
ncbi:DUF2218 domain-containing protein [Methylopila sp. M107]|uniref:DUF2218 domain-containing protein n=1 Tax=Methylopila sp. M107 TaxID=1101190 RepID=UPI000380DCE6|nr:DUF2218 domain-containing protein [Methylopila sp. M107]